MPLSAGDRIGPYSVTRLLGTGGMGEVYLARDVRLRRAVALKRVSDRIVATPDVRHQLLNEARAAAQLTHPNIAAVHDVIEHGDHAYIVMEYVEGESLADRTRSGRLALAEIIRIGVQLAGAVAAAHAHGIIHRDLKPANVHLTPQGDVKVLDFGVARILPRADPDAETGSADWSFQEAARLIGTPAYMAPEQLSGGRVDARTDVYSFGVLLFELVTGRRPFEEPDLLGLASAILTQPAPAADAVASDVAPEAAALIARMLEKAPDRRPQSMDAVRDELLRIGRTLEGSGVVPAPTRVSSIFRSKPVVAALVVILAGVAAWTGWRAWPRAADERVPVIVVLPLTTIGGPDADRAIGEGIAKSVETALFDAPGVRVRTCTNPRECPSVNRDPIRIARELDADLIVDGRVHRSNKALRVTLQLLDARSNEIVWTMQADGLEDQIFRTQDQVARELAVHLQEARSVPIDADRVAARARLRSTTSIAALEKYSRALILLTRPDALQNVVTATDLLEDAVADDPKYALAYAALGRAYWIRYQEDQNPAWADRARQACLNALAIDHEQLEVRLALAGYYSGTRDFEKATEQLEIAFSIQPDSEEALRVRAVVLADQGHFDAALADADRAVGLSPGYWRHHLTRGYVLYSAGRRDEARASYQQVVEMQPDNAWGWHMLGVISMEENDRPRALEEFTRAIEAYESARTLSNIGTVHYWDGHYGDAAEFFERASALEPHNPVHFRNAGDAYVKLKQPQKARAAYERAVGAARRLLDDVNRRDPHRLAQLAVYEAKVGRFGDARQHVAAAETFGPVDAVVLYRKAVVEALAGDAAASWQALQGAMQKGLSATIACQDDDLQGLSRQKEFAALCAG